MKAESATMLRRALSFVLLGLVCVLGGAVACTPKAAPRTSTTHKSIAPACAAWSWARCQGPGKLRLGDVVRVADFGATSAGGGDDGSAIQDAVCCAIAMKDDGGTGRGVVDFGAGTYNVERPIYVAPGITLLGKGSTLIELSDGVFRNFEGEYRYSASLDAEPLIIMDFTLVGAASAKPASALIELDADPRSAGRVVATLKNLLLRGGLPGEADAPSPSSGIQIGSRVAARVQGVVVSDLGGKAEDPAGFALRVTGSGNELQVVDFTARQASLHDGRPGRWQLENAGGMYVLRNVHLDGALQLGLADDASTRVLASGLLARGGPFFLRAPRGSVRISDSELGSNEQSDDARPIRSGIVSGGQVVLSHTTFIAHESIEGASTALSVLNIRSSARGSVELNDCVFDVDASVEPADVVTGVSARADGAQIGKLTLRGGRLASALLDVGVRVTGGNATIQDALLDLPGTAVSVSSPAGQPLALALAGLQLGQAVRCAFDVSAVVAPGNVEFRNLQLDLWQTQGCGFDPHLTSSGQRVILGAAPPSNALDCYVGDLYRLNAPRAGAGYEWLCVARGAWRPLSSLQ